VVTIAAFAAAGAAHNKSFFTVGAQEDGSYVVPNGPTAARFSGNNCRAFRC
jgi:hypothetical protein